MQQRGSVVSALLGTFMLLRLPQVHFSRSKSVSRTNCQQPNRSIESNSCPLSIGKSYPRRLYLACGQTDGQRLRIRLSTLFRWGNKIEQSRAKAAWTLPVNFGIVLRVTSPWHHRRNPCKKWKRTQLHCHTHLSLLLRYVAPNAKMKTLTMQQKSLLQFLKNRLRNLSRSFRYLGGVRRKQTLQWGIRAIIAGTRIIQHPCSRHLINQCRGKGEHSRKTGKIFINRYTLPSETTNQAHSNLCGVQSPGIHA